VDPPGAALALSGVVAIFLILELIGRWAEPLLSDQSAYRFTPIAMDPGGQTACGVWSPDGKAFAYSGNSPSQIFVRYLDSDVPRQLTHMPQSVYAIRWTPDSRRIFFGTLNPPTVWSIAATGGEPR